MSDSWEKAARYRAQQQGHDGDAPAEPEGESAQRAFTAENRAAYVESAIQIALRRGDFDNLPGAGKPLDGLGGHHDPNWWIRRKIETDNLTGLGPPALMLRDENRRLNSDLDLLGRESDVRTVVEDFNARVRAARRQLLGGPPVVTPVRDVEHEIAKWRERREARAAAAAAQAAEELAAAIGADARRRRWFRKR